MKIQVLVCLVLCSICLCWGFILGHAESKPATLEQVVEKMPNTLLKANLLVVIGADKADGGEELGQVMMGYAAMKIQEYKKSKNVL